MIRLNFENVLRSNIGFRNGISARVLKKKLLKHQKLIQYVFKNKAKPGYAFLDLPKDKKLVQSIRQFSKTQKGKWEHIVVLGIGGSSLGLITLQESLIGPYHYLLKVPRLHVVDNIDPDYVYQLSDNIGLKKALFIVVSKSGGTTEPMSLYSYFRQKLIDKKIKNISDHFVFVTDAKEGLLRKIGVEENIKMFPVPDKVGGRFSVLSAVGLLPAALVGIDIVKLLKGANEMVAQIKKTPATENPALILALLQHHLDLKLKKPMTVLMPYSNFLFKVGDWYRQLLAESIGKNSKAGPTPINALGSTDQHSQLQLYSQGPNNKWFIFFRVMSHRHKLKLSNHLPDKISFLNGKSLSQIIDASYSGTVGSLTKNSRPNVTIEVDQINPESIGGLFILFEFQMALLGLLYGVNAFDQPGVEESKVITKKILSEG